MVSVYLSGQLQPTTVADVLIPCLYVGRDGKLSFVQRGQLLRKKSDRFTVDSGYDEAFKVKRQLFIVICEEFARCRSCGRSRHGNINCLFVCFIGLLACLFFVPLKKNFELV